MTTDQMEKEVMELYYDLVVTSIKEDFIDLILTFAKKIRKETITEQKNKFIRAFCNDHNEKIRWLRGVAVDLPHLLELILNFYDEEIRALEVES